MKDFLQKFIFSLLIILTASFLSVGGRLARAQTSISTNAVPVEEVGWNREWNFRTSEYTNSLVELLGEIVGPIYQLSTPGSELTYDIYRFLMKHTEDELGIDKDFFRRMKKKQPAPTVDIVFAPTNPKEGELVTAFAIPRDFKNSPKKLYYTWYLLRDGEDDLEVARKRGMRLTAAGRYNTDLFGEPDGDDKNQDAYNASYGGDDGVGKKSIEKKCNLGCEVVRNMSMFGGEIKEGWFDDQGVLLYSSKEEYEEMKKSRGENGAALGRGVVNSKYISRCYRHNFGAGGDNGDKDKGTFAYSGRDLVIKCQHAFGDRVGDRVYEKREEKRWGTNWANPDTDGDGVLDEADLAGLGQDSFSWTYHKGDRISVAVEGTSKIPINEGSTDRLRYGPDNTDWDKKSSQDKDLSPKTSPEEWYKKKREECQKLRKTSSNNAFSDCMKDLWEHERKDKNDEDAFGDMTAYYKIMWAAPGICSENRMEEAKNDWCDKEGDIGFQYLKLYSPIEEKEDLLEVSVSVFPEDPQFSLPGDDDASDQYSDSTDLIVAIADVIDKQRKIDPDYLYYSWKIFGCEPNKLDECKDITPELAWQSHREGAGVREIGFYPTKDVFDLFQQDKILLKIGVIVKRHKNATISSPGINGQYAQQRFPDTKIQDYAFSADRLVEIIKHNLKIKLYSAEPDDNGSWQENGLGEICEEGLYKKVCPVFPQQVIKAEIDGAGLGSGISWLLNGKKIARSDTVNRNADSDEIFFPITASEGSLLRLTAVVDAGEGEEVQVLKEERLLSVNLPKMVIIDPGEEVKLGQTIKRAYNRETGQAIYNDESEVWWALAYDPLKEDPIKHNVYFLTIPYYLQDAYEFEMDNQLSFQAYVNGNLANNDLVNVDFIDDENGRRSDYSLYLEEIVFSGKEENIDDFRIRAKMSFSDKYLKSFWNSFKVSPLEELVAETKVKVQNITAEKYRAITGKEVYSSGQRETAWRQKAGKILASTLNNAPEYLIFLIRLFAGVAVILVVFFGLRKVEDEN